VSLRALGRQFAAQLANRNKPWIAGTEARPQGRLFDPGRIPNWRPGPDLIESGRRRDAGEANPEAPWRTPFLQHHFLKHPEPVQGEL
jgi:hypothetical protein